jgi:hypothetical protein
MGSLKTWTNYNKRNVRWIRVTEGVIRGTRRVQDTSSIYSQLSGLEDSHDAVFNDFIKDDFIPEDQILEIE